MIVWKIGERIKGRRGEWREHHYAFVDGKQLDGFVQYRRRYHGKRLGHRIEITTHCGDAAVQGENFDWLMANQPQPT